MNRRTTFRAAVHDFSQGALIVDRNLLRVRIVDLSAGGLCVSYDQPINIARDKLGRLKLDNGDMIDVAVAYSVIEGRKTRIGLRRFEGPPQPRMRSLPRISFALFGVSAGFIAGLLVLRWL